MTLTFNGQLFSFVFRYEENVPNPRKVGELCKRTTCIVREGTAKEAKEIGRGNAYCVIGDIFCKKCGRLSAFKRVLKTMGLDRQGRTAFFNAYAEMVHNKWRQQTVTNDSEIQVIQVSVTRQPYSRYFKLIIMNLTSFLFRKKGQSHCPSQIGIKMTPSMIQARLPEFYNENVQRINQDIIQVYVYEENQIFAIIDTEVRQAFFQEYGS